MVDRDLYGTGPFGFHLTNIVIHALSTLLLFFAMFRLTRSLWKSALVASVFGVHPLRVESVVWIAERKDVLSAFFWVLTMLAYSWYVELPSTRRYFAVLAAFTLGLMAKPTLVTLPFALLLLDYWPLGRLKPGHTNRGARTFFVAVLPILEKLPLLVLSLIASVIAYVAQRSTGAVSEGLPLGVKIANAIVSYVAYLWKTIWPRNLACLYPHPEENIPEWHVLGSAFVLICLTVAILRISKTRGYLGFGWLWYLGTLLPVIGIIQIGPHGMADRFTYIPTIGIAVIAIWGISDLLSGSSHHPHTWCIQGCAACLVILSLAACTWIQSGYWENSERLFRRALALTSRNHVVANNLALVLASKGKIDEAVALYKKALYSAPPELKFKILNNLGFALAERGQLDDAIRYYREALAINPDSAEVHTNLGKALYQKGRSDEAVHEFEEALRVNPSYAEALVRLGLIRPERANPQQMIAYYREALKTNPRDALLHLNLGLALAKENKVDEAITHFRRSLEIDPKSAEAHNNLGTALAGRGDLDGAFEHFMQAVRLKPDYAEAHFNLGNVLAARGDQDGALRHFLIAVKLKPDYSQAHFNLAVAYFYKGEYKRAWQEVNLCRRYGMNPDPNFLSALSQKMPEP